MADIHQTEQLQAAGSTMAANLPQEKGSAEQASVAASGLPASPGQLISGSNKAKLSQQQSSKIPSAASLSLSTSSKTRFPSDPLASTGSATALLKLKSERESAAVTSGSTSVAATISKAKEALALARARAAAAATGQGSLSSGVSSRVVEGSVSDKPFTLYGKVDIPPPRPQVQVHLPNAQEAARRKAWQAEKEALRQRRLQQEAAAKEREAAAKAAAAAARAEEHKRRVEERKARNEAYKAREAELMARSEAAWREYQQQRGRPPLFKTMEDDYLARRAADEEARRAAYETQVASAKLATVSQLVSGEVVIKPTAGSISPGRSRSPGTSIHSSLGSGDHSQALLAARQPRSPGRGGSLAASWQGPAAGPGRTLMPRATPRQPQLVDRASSPLTFTADGPLPPGVRVIPTHLARQETNECSRSPAPQDKHGKQASPDYLQSQEEQQHGGNTPEACEEVTLRPGDRHEPAASNHSRKGSLSAALAAAVEEGEDDPQLQEAQPAQSQSRSISQQQATGTADVNTGRSPEQHTGKSAAAAGKHSRKSSVQQVARDKGAGEHEGRQSVVSVARTHQSARHSEEPVAQTGGNAVHDGPEQLRRSSAGAGEGSSLPYSTHSSASRRAAAAVAVGADSSSQLTAARREHSEEADIASEEGAVSEAAADHEGGAEDGDGNKDEEEEEEQGGSEPEAADVEASEQLEAAEDDGDEAGDAARRLSGSSAEDVGEEGAAAAEQVEAGGAQRRRDADPSGRTSLAGEEVEEDIKTKT